MKDYQRDFLDFVIAAGVLRFGEFTLKSGRKSPYFFNAGAFDTGGAQSQLGRYYAAAIRESGVMVDMLYGPAYKGIPLAVATAIGLYEAHGIDLPYAFNRKEKKAHGEGGTIVGRPLFGRIMVIDDVISAGTSVRESASLIGEAGATLAGVTIALDRQERGSGETSAIQEVEDTFNIRVISIVSLATLIAYLESRPDLNGHLEPIRAYQARYGALRD